jgi:hypothetical protein
MPSDRPSIELFLSPAGDARQSLARGLPPGALARAPGADTATSTDSAHPTTYLDPGGDPNSLRDQGWGVIAPRGEAGDHLLALARPLLDKRAADQDAEVPVYRVAPDMTAAQAAAWVDRKLVDNALHDAIPGYLLVLGGPAQVSFELQQVLATGFSVGRVGFAAADGIMMLPVNFAVARKTIIFRTAPDTLLAVYADGPVGFEVDRLDAARRARQR